MKSLIKRWLLRHELASIAAELEVIQRERVNLERVCEHLVRRSNRVRLQLLNSEIRGRRA